MRRDPNERRDTPMACTFTLRPENSSAVLGRLSREHAPRLKAGLRTDFNRVMASMDDRPGGMLFACLHGSYDPAIEAFSLHWHGVATGGKIDVINGLRELDKYKPAVPGDGRDAANTPVVMSREPLSNMPDPLTYLLQRWWNERETYLDADGKRKAFGGLRRGITGPAYAEYLAFLDRWAVKDLTLLMGMHVTRHGLVAR